MKRGCLFLLFCWIALGVADYFMLKGSELESEYWLPVVLSLLVVLTLTNLQGIIITFAQKRASSIPFHQLRDGQLVGTSGIIQSSGQTLLAPFSGQRVVMAEYDVKRTVRTGENHQSVSDFRGMMAVPCTINSTRGSMKIVGFPLFANFKPKQMLEIEEYIRAACYLAAANLRKLSKNPLTIIKELNAVLKDNDGIVQADFISTDVSIPDDYAKQHQNSFQSEDEDIEEQKILEAEDRTASQALKNDRERNFYRYLRNGAFELLETTVPDGAEVTVFGSYRAESSAIDIGNGLQNLKHQIHPGKIDQVLAAQFRKSLIMTVIFAALTAGSHYYVADLIGIDFENLRPILEKLKLAVS